MDIQELLKHYGIFPVQLLSTAATSISGEAQASGKSQSENVESIILSDRQGSKPKSFAEVFEGNTKKTWLTTSNGSADGQDKVVPLVQTPPPLMEGGNMAMVIDEEENLKGVEENIFNVLGKLSLQRGAEQITTFDLREKLAVVWGLSKFMVIPIRRGFFTCPWMLCLIRAWL